MTDFDGVPYRKNVWPGSFRNPFFDALFHAEPVIFSSPLFQDRWGHKENFSRVAFETDMPRIEFATNPPCQRHLSNPSDPNPGAGCVNPPVGQTSTRSTARGRLTRKGITKLIRGITGNASGRRVAGSFPER